MKDLHNLVRTKVGIAAVAAGTTGTGQAGKVVDRAGYHGVEIILNYGTITSTAATFTVTIKEGDATGTMTSVANADLLGTEALAGVAAGARTSGSTKNVTKRIGYIGKKRYVQCSIVNTATAATPVSATFLLYNPETAPTANP